MGNKRYVLTQKKENKQSHQKSIQGVYFKELKKKKKKREPNCSKNPPAQKVIYTPTMLKNLAKTCQYPHYVHWTNPNNLLTLTSIMDMDTLIKNNFLSDWLQHNFSLREEKKNSMTVTKTIACYSKVNRNSLQ